MSNIELYKSNHSLIKSSGRIPALLIPKTIEESVVCLAQYPDEYYATLSPVNVVQCINSPVCTLGAFKRATMSDTNGDTTARAMVLIMLTDIVGRTNVGKTMNDFQLAETAKTIIANYGYLKIDDFKLCFDYARKGYYGKLYDCIDEMVIIGWLEAYITDRFNQGEKISALEHDKVKAIEVPAESLKSILNRNKDEKINRK